MAGPTTPGWYPDPGQAGQDRFWFGSQWSKLTRPAALAVRVKSEKTRSGSQSPPPSFGTLPWWLAPLAAAVGGVFLVIGSMLPWATVSIAFITITVAGTHGSGDGWFTLAFGVGLAIAGTALVRSWWSAGFWTLAIAVLSLGSLAVALYEVIHLLTIDTQVTSSDGLNLKAGISVGGGLVFTLIVAVVLVVIASACVRGWLSRRPSAAEL